MTVTVLDLAALSTAIYEDSSDWPLISSVAGRWHKTLEKYYPDTLNVEIMDTLIAYGAQESKNPVVQKMAKQKIAMDTGLRTALYISAQEKKSVLVVRGTVAENKNVDFGTIGTDLNYVFDGRAEMLDQLITFFYAIKASQFTKDYPLIAVTGHSLGGIMAKMLAPVSKLPTYAFNSPGVLEYLEHNKNGYPTHASAEIVTYCAQGDPIGNLRHDHDIGKYQFLPIGDKIPENSARIKSKEYWLYFRANLFDFHSMILMYKYLLNTNGSQYSSKVIQ